MKTGERILKDLEAKEISQSAVARKSGVTPQSVRRWIDDFETITDEQWMKFARGLKAVGLSPESYRPLPMPRSNIRAELVPLLEVFKEKRQLEALIALLRADEDPRGTVLLVAEERLRHMK